MIITKCPHRISLLGGSSDLVDFLETEKGKVLSFAINKYMYIIINKRMDNKIRLRYFANELVDTADELKHDIVRYCLKKLNITGIEIVSLSDIPANCGLSSSSSFACALLLALYEYQGIKKSQKEIADEVCKIELKLNHTTGRQDSYGCAIGGMKFIEFVYNEKVNIIPVQFKDSFHENIKIIFLKKRASESAYSILKTYNTENNYQKQIKIYCDEAEKDCSFNTISYLLQKTWEEKKLLSDLISDKQTDKILNNYKKKGWNGKVGGAGNGGFLVLMREQIEDVTKFSNNYNLIELDYKIDTEGLKVVHNENI